MKVRMYTLGSVRESEYVNKANANRNASVSWCWCGGGGGGVLWSIVSRLSSSSTEECICSSLNVVPGAVSRLHAPGTSALEVLQRQHPSQRPPISPRVLPLLQKLDFPLPLRHPLILFIARHHYFPSPIPSFDNIARTRVGLAAGVDSLHA